MFKYILLIISIFSGSLFPALAQTEADALLMNPGQLCAGFTGMHSSWTHYWEGKRNRTNENLGRVSTRSLSLMANYGLAKNWNLLAAASYVSTSASAGTLMGQQGLQDGELWLKYRPFQRQWGKQKISLLVLAGASAPLSRYTADFLPLSIGLQSVKLNSRIMADYEWSRFFVTAHGTYTHRRNIKIDREAYYTDHMVYSREVFMPDQLGMQLRTGYRTPGLLAEAVLSRMSTLGGFDISRNNMPFASNRMNATQIGAHMKYYLPGKLKNLSADGMVMYTADGRNVGQAIQYGAGLFYLMQLTGKKTSRPAVN